MNADSIPLPVLACVQDGEREQGEGPQKTDPAIVGQVLKLVEDEMQTRLDEEGLELKDYQSVILYDIGPERAAEVFHGLEEVGLLVRRHKVEELAEQIAQERLRALKAEHGLAA